MTARNPHRPIRVLFPRRRPTTNPYLVMIRDALQGHPDVELVDLSWKEALLGDWDVLHLHWPEILITGRTPNRRRAKQAALAALLARMRLTGRALVRTYHNVEERTDLTATQRRLLRRVDAQTSLWIVLNTVAVPDTNAPIHLIPHGHYRDWYARFARSEAVPGRIGYFGLIRPYKSLDVLVSAFRAALQVDPRLSLAIAGKPAPPELADELIALSGADPRIGLRFEYLTEEELVAHVTGSALIALTHREMFNSGTALAALSLDRPVLMPRTPLNEELAAEIGPDWVLLYDEPLCPENLLDALAAVPTGSPDLSNRDWEVCGQAHVDAYRTALGEVRG